MNKILYHNDIMGYAAVNVLRLITAGDYEAKPVAFSALSQGFAKKGDVVFLAGLFPKDYILEKLAKENILYVYTNSDEQIAVCDKLIDKGLTIRGTRKTEEAPCLSMWKDHMPDKEPPKVLLYLSDYHTWTFRYDETEKFKYGISLLNTKPGYKTEGLWNELLSNNPDLIDQCLSSGKDVYDYHTRLFTIYQELFSYGTKLFDIPALAINVKYNSTILADHRNEAFYKVFVCYEWDNTMRRYRVSLYSNDDNIDVGALARRFDGNGSKGVAGFICSVLPFEERAANHEDDIDGKDPLPYEDIYADIKHLLKKFSVAKFNHKQNQTNVLMRAFSTVMENIRVMACNTPYDRADAFYGVDLTGEQLLVTYVWTNYDKYRVVMMPVSDNVDLQTLASKYGGKVVDGKVVAYLRMLPFTIN